MEGTNAFGSFIVVKEGVNKEGSRYFVLRYEAPGVTTNTFAYQNRDGSIFRQNPDSSQSYVFPDGTIRHTSPAGSVRFIKPAHPNVAARAAKAECDFFPVPLFFFFIFPGSIIAILAIVAALVIAIHLVHTLFRKNEL